MKTWARGLNAPDFLQLSPDHTTGRMCSRDLPVSQPQALTGTSLGPHVRSSSIPRCLAEHVNEGSEKPVVIT